jgi:hypothetical protein
VASREGTLPIGATRTVIHVYSGGHAYQIEFDSPFHTIVTVAAAALANR